MKYSAKILIISAVLATSPLGLAHASDVKFEASLDRDSVALGDRAQLGLTFYGTQSMPAPDLGNMDGLDVKYLGPSTMMTVLNGRVSSSVTHMYIVLPLRTGRFQMGPYTFNYQGNKYASNIAFLNVTEEKTAPEKRIDEPALADQNLEDRLFLTLSLGKTGAYVNELVPVKVKLYVTNMNVRDIQLPTFGQEGFSKAEFKEPKQYREDVSGVTYDVLEFTTNIFATRPGDYKLGPAKVKCNLIVQKKTRGRGFKSMDEFFASRFDEDNFDDSFTRFERQPYELKSQESPLIVSPLPVEGRPADFSGAVGDFQFIFNANPKKLKAGDPITLNMEINGTGNFNTVLIPKLENTDGFKVYEPQVKTEASSKVFTQVVIPESEKPDKTPKAIFNYFDPIKKEYKTISQGSLSIEVEKAREEAPAQVVGPLAPIHAGYGEEKLTRDIIYIKDALGIIQKKYSKFYHNKIFLALLVIPFILLILVYVSAVRKETLERDSAYAGRMMAYKLAKKYLKSIRHQLNASDTKGYYELLFKALQEYMGNRLNIPSAGITFDTVESTLKPKDIDMDIMRKLKTLFNICDEARFARIEINEFRMKDDLKEFEEVVKYFERVKL